MTVTVLRPDSTVLNTNVNTSGGASAFSVLDDSPDNDATIAQGSANRAEARLGLTTTTVGATSRVLQARIRARGEHEGTDIGHAENVNLRLYDPTTKQSGRNNGFSTYTYASFTAYSAGWETTPPGGTAWSQAIVDRLQARAFWTASVNGFFLKVSELYVDLDIYTQPAVSAVTVTGATSTTSPDFSYTFTQAEGLPQEARQVKVFSAAQYGAAGFDPATSAATWDSGVVLGPDATGTVGVALTNGTTYKAYAAAGIGWPAGQGLGAYWYSTWVASGAFTIVLTPPPAPTITVTQQLGVPHYRNMITASLAGLNLLTLNQASLETDTTGWAAVANCTISRSTAWFADGAASLQLSSTASGNMSAAVSVRPRVKPGARVVATATGRSAVSVRSVRVDIRWYDVAGAVISTTTGTAANDATGADVPWWATGVAPASTYSADVLVNVLATGAGAEVHRFDKIALYYYPSDPGSAAAAAALWTPGGYTTGAAVTVYRSQRISKNIARGPARNWLHPQVFSCGAITTAADGFSVRGANDTVRVVPLDRAPPEAPGQVTAGMFEWTCRASSSYLDIGMPDSVASDGLHPYLFPAVPGKSMTASVWLWAGSAMNVRLGIYYVDRYNNSLGLTFGGSTGLTATEQKVSVAATPPAGTCFARLVVENSTPTTGVQVFGCMPRFRVTSDPDEAWPGQVFSWETEIVRALSSTAFVDGQSDITVVDHEPPAGRPVLYWARLAATTAAGLPIVSVDGTAVHVYNDPPARTLLKDPYQPENADMARILADQDFTQDEDAGTFHVLGRDGDPVVWRDWLGGVDGRIAVFAQSDLERYRLDQLHPSARPLLVQFSAGGNTYIRITGRALRPQMISKGYWRYEFTYVQVGRP